MIAHLILLALVGCDWITLARNALTYRTTARGEAANLAVLDSLVYATAGENGLTIVDSHSGVTVATLAPAPGAGSIDDLAIDGELLFTLDARPPGTLTVYSLADPATPRLLAAPVEVPVGPFSGVSAARGLCIVSGGTSSLTVWRYASAGLLQGPLTSTDLGRGQPDVTISPNGTLAWVSTHYRGPRFGLDVVRYDSTTHTLAVLGAVPLDGAGFTDGGAKPANFPIETAPLGHDSVLVAFGRGVAILSTPLTKEPSIVQQIDLGGAAVNVDTRDRTAAVLIANPEPALAILDFTVSPPSIKRRLPLPVGTFPTAVAFVGARVAVATRRGVQFYDP